MNDKLVQALRDYPEMLEYLRRHDPHLVGDHNIFPTRSDHWREALNVVNQAALDLQLARVHRWEVSEARLTVEQAARLLLDVWPEREQVSLQQLLRRAGKAWPGNTLEQSALWGAYRTLCVVNGTVPA